MRSIGFSFELHLATLEKRWQFSRERRSASSEHPVSNRIIASDSSSTKPLTGEVLNEIAQLLGPGDLRQKNATLKSIEDLRETRVEMIDRRLNITG